MSDQNGDSTDAWWEQEAHKEDEAAERKEPCRCNCGYTCGGLGVCKLDIVECIEKHWKKDCEHDFSGPLVRIDENTQSVVCQKCGVSAIGHDMMCGP